MLGGNGADSLSGGDKSDVLTGGGGSDILTAGAGKDTLTGGLGADRLAGGGDRDTFVFAAGHSTPAAADTITDFQAPGAAAGDRIDLSAIDARADLAGDQAFVFGGTGAGHLRVVEEGGRSIVLGNVDASAASELRIVLDDGGTAAAAYAAADFVL
ncbi:MAG: hypothetical protein QM699_14270 [Amaricoccus sp.]